MPSSLNVFFRCKTVVELDDDFDLRTSPKVLMWDGERDVQAARADRDDLTRQYNERFAQLVGFAMTAPTAAAR